MSESEGSDNDYYDQEDYDEEVSPSPVKEGDPAAQVDPTAVEQPGGPEAASETKDEKEVDPD